MLISAAEARKRINIIDSEEEKRQLEEIENNINKDMKKGYTYFYKNMMPSVKTKLNELGYEVIFSSDQRDGNIYTIKW